MNGDRSTLAIGACHPNVVEHVVPQCAVVRGGIVIKNLRTESAGTEWPAPVSETRLSPGVIHQILV